MSANRPLIGIGVLIFKGTQVLLGKRKNAHGDGRWAPPGGHLEFGEEPEDCAKREVLEETGLDIEVFHKSVITNDVFPKENKHYVTLYMIGEYISGTPKAMEPHKCEGWDWFEWEALPSPLFLTLENLLKTNFHPKFTK